MEEEEVDVLCLVFERALTWIIHCGPICDSDAQCHDYACGVQSPINSVTEGHLRVIHSEI